MTPDTMYHPKNPNKPKDVNISLPKLFLSFLDFLDVGAFVGDELLGQNFALVEALGTGLDPVLELVELGLEHQKMLEILAVVLAGGGLLLLLDPLLEPSTLQEVLVSVHAFHESLLSHGGQSLKGAHLLGNGLLLAGDGFAVGVFRVYHGRRGVAHFHDDAVVGVQFEFQGLKKGVCVIFVLLDILCHELRKSILDHQNR